MPYRRHQHQPSLLIQALLALVLNGFSPVIIPINNHNIYTTGTSDADVNATMRSQICTTCDRELPINQFPKLPKGGKCTYERETCWRCWHQWLASQVESKAWDQIGCAQCGNLLGQGESKASATEKVYQQYLDSELKATLSADPDFKWCFTPGCKSGQVHSECEIFRCVSYGYKHCVECHVNWHGGETCEEYQVMVQYVQHVQQKQEEDSAKMLEKNAKLCPGPGCGRKVEKLGGCDHVKSKFPYSIIGDLKRSVTA